MHTFIDGEQGLPARSAAHGVLAMADQRLEHAFALFCLNLALTPLLELVQELPEHFLARPTRKFLSKCALKHTDAVVSGSPA